MREILVFLILLYLLGGVYSIDFPKPPSMPKFPLRSSSSEGSAKSDKGVLYNIEVTTFKGSKLGGKFSLKNEGITIKNKKDDFVFYKKLLYKDMKSIEFVKWGGSEINSGHNRKGGKLYVFYPLEYRFVDKGGETFSFYGRIRELEKFELSNELGTTVVYGIFYDYWTGKSWRNSKSRKFQYNQSTANPSCLKKIEFKGR